MTANPQYRDVQGAVELLHAGARLYVIEERPYPEPHQVVIVQDDERYSITYNNFAVLISNHLIQSIGQTIFDGFAADTYILARDQAGQEK